MSGKNANLTAEKMSAFIGTIKTAARKSPAMTAAISHCVDFVETGLSAMDEPHRRKALAGFADVESDVLTYIREMEKSCAHLVKLRSLMFPSTHAGNIVILENAIRSGVRDMEAFAESIEGSIDTFRRIASERTEQEVREAFLPYRDFVSLMGRYTNALEQMQAVLGQLRSTLHVSDEGQEIG